jgi:hypothetical protein
MSHYEKVPLIGTGSGVLYDFKCEDPLPPHVMILWGEGVGAW